MPILPYKFIHPVFLFSPPDKGSTFKFIKKYLKGYGLESLILLALEISLRRNELLALSWKNVDTKKSSIHVVEIIKRIAITSATEKLNDLFL
ncbi:hypothetical protein [Clostridium botulinum]|uniref:hypothetical protein n=1 Tax=Clostridium botulinum TaxID=1491 RepID=UPI000D1372CC|nr:hypothetical protein [Clostridium botulinum]AVQ47205.1 hypothetical protein C7M60_16030 [Clostridium botulinum]AVQ50797.1 hypothetical protein C7M58_16265 [Clostridium botulinum]HDK7175257.1 hypothetical protein [Clostridium botulinum]